jgi:polysaccharide export outer membrane protein
LGVRFCGPAAAPSYCPMQGPNALAVKSGHVERAAYSLVKLSPDVVNILDEYGPRTLSAFFGDHRPPPKIKFGNGDVVGVAAAGGLYIPSEAGVRPGNFVTLPKLTSQSTPKGSSPSPRRASPDGGQDTLAG